jgi:hypothetical protein
MSRHNENDAMTFPDAYWVIWGAGNVAFDQHRTRPNIKCLVGEEIAALFDRLDLIKRETNLYIESTSDDSIPTITLKTLLGGVYKKMNSIYQEQSAGHEQPISPFMIEDDRLTALMGLDLYIRISKNRLFDR